MNAAALSLRDLEYVVAVADENHFGRAAERCAVSQPTLSVQVRKLEEALGITIFERTNRRVLLTPAGQAVVRQARAVLAEAQRLVLLAHEGHGAPLSGRLVLAAIQTLGPYLFPHVLRQIRQDFPQLSLALSEGRTAGILEGLREGRLDAALISLPIPEAGLTVAPLFREPFLLACPSDHAFAAGDPPRANDLAGPDLLLLDEGNCLRDQALAACGAGGTAGRHATSLETLRSMVAAGAGYTLLPALAAPAGPDPSGLTVCRRFGEDGPDRVIALAWRASDPRGDGMEQLAAFFRAQAPAATYPCGGAKGARAQAGMRAAGSAFTERV
ncbi:LysR substrate-binding domain-containing protein [Methylobacterium sp. JK268]